MSCITKELLVRARKVQFFPTMRIAVTQELDGLNVRAQSRRPAFLGYPKQYGCQTSRYRSHIVNIVSFDPAGFLTTINQGLQ